MTRGANTKDFKCSFGSRQAEGAEQGANETYAELGEGLLVTSLPTVRSHASVGFRIWVPKSIPNMVRMGTKQFTAVQTQLGAGPGSGNQSELRESRDPSKWLVENEDSAKFQVQGYGKEDLFATGDRTNSGKGQNSNAATGLQALAGSFATQTPRERCDGKGPGKA